MINCAGKKGSTNESKQLIRINRYHRFLIIKEFCHLLSKIEYLRIICIVCEKSKLAPEIEKEQVFLKSWDWLLNRFNTTLQYNNFPGENSINNGIVVSDQTNINVIQKQLRKMRKYNPVSNNEVYGIGYRNLKTTNIIEDVFERESRTSYFVQAADTVSYVFRQHFEPNKYMKSKGGKNLYKMLLPLIPRVITRKSSDGIVWLT